jgi:hypothetical protein
LLLIQVINFLAIYEFGKVNIYKYFNQWHDR